MSSSTFNWHVSPTKVFLQSAGGYEGPTWSIASTSVHHFTCGQANCAQAVTDRSVTSRTVAQHIESVTHHSVSARTIRQRLQQSRLSTIRPLLGLPLTQNHRRLRRQWCNEKRIWATEWNEVVFTDESRICLQHHNGRIRVWRHRGDRILNSCVMHHHTGPAPGIIEDFGRRNIPGKRARRQFSQLSEFESSLIIGMKTAGWSTRRVAGQVDRSECAVRSYWEQWTREGTHAWKTGSRATRKTTRRED
ncbi:transposable element Tcb1 transposase [Trichonephila clavipes]|nr:transposable element Tcb1 transposase [Trichonephila clavipes]